MQRTKFNGAAGPLRRGIALVITLLLALSLLAFARTQAAQEATRLELNQPVARTLASGQAHSYQIALTAGQYLQVTVTQRGIDVVVVLFGPDGKQLAEFDHEPRSQGQETVAQVAAASGDYRLEVKPRQQGAAGDYELRVVELRAATERDRALQEARQLYARAETLWRANKYAEALPLAERALALLEEELGSEHPEVALFLNRLATIHHSKGDPTQAAPLYQRALAIREQTLGAEHPHTTASLNNLATLYSNQSNYAQAEPLFQRLLAIREKTLGAEHPNTAVTLHNLGNLYYFKGEYAQAEPLYLRALAIREKTLGREHQAVASTVNMLAVLYRDKGAYAQAEPLYRRAIAIWEKTLDPEHPSVAGAIHNLAILYWTKGDYVQAEPLFQRALALQEKRLPADHVDTGDSLSDLALLYYEKGDYAQAESLFRRTLALAEKAEGAAPGQRVARALANLGLVYRAKRDHAQAEPLLRRTLAIREKVLGAAHPSTADSLDILGAVYFDQGDYAQSKQLGQRARAIREKALGTEHPDVATSLYNLAMIHYRQQNYAAARPLLQRALAIREKMLGVEHPAVARCLVSLASVSTAEGALTEAIALQTRAAVINERNLALNLTAGSERQKLAYLATLAAESNETIALHVRAAPNNPAALNLAATTILQRKGRALDVMTDSLAALRRRAGPAEQALLDQLQDTTSQLARLVLGGPQRTAPADYQQRIKDLEAQVEKLQTAISHHSAEFLLQAQPVTLAAVQAAIPAPAALIEFYTYHPYEPRRSAKPEGKHGAPRYVAYILRRQGAPQWVDLGAAVEIDAAAGALRQALRQRRPDVKRLARVVDRLVMQPLRPLLGATRRVLLSPDGTLNLVPFTALVDERQRYLVESYHFSYLTSGRDLLRLQTRQASRQGMLIVANPSFGALPGAGDPTAKLPKTPAPAAPALSFADVFFTPLPGTASEAETLKQLFPNATLLAAAQATEAALKQASGPRLLHIATHGFFLNSLPTVPTATRGLGLSGSAAPLGELSANPMLRSGLALAGANQRQQGGADGILTALEAAGLDLWGTQLVVLSACDTGVGEVRNGDGVYGLRRALTLAGAEAQLMSLWPVSDRGTRDLMIAYYQALQRGAGRSEALRQVQLRMLRSGDRQHPYYWASFIQSGEGKNLDGKEVGAASPE